MGGPGCDAGELASLPQSSRGAHRVHVGCQTPPLLLLLLFLLLLFTSIASRRPVASFLPNRPSNASESGSVRLVFLRGLTRRRSSLFPCLVLLLSSSSLLTTCKRHREVVVVLGGGGGVVAVKGGERVGGGERRYATLPQAPPLPDWKVMGLKETFSQLSPHLRLSLALLSYFLLPPLPFPLPTHACATSSRALVGQSHT